MTEPVQIEGSSNSKMLKAMVGIGAICALLIVMTYELTLPRIENLKEDALQEAIFKVIPGISQTKAFKLKDGKFVELKDEKPNAETIYAGYNEENEFLGLAIPAEGQGYADIIKILYGYDPANQVIIGMYVLESKETPGLGDKIEKDENFKSNFVEMDVRLTEDKSKLINDIKTVKSGEKKNSWEIDGITGATISSRAIGRILDNSTNEWMPIIQSRIDDFIIK